MKVGLVGKPNAGKSTFFTAVTSATAQIGDYPFTTIANIFVNSSKWKGTYLCRS